MTVSEISVTKKQKLDLRKKLSNLWISYHTEPNTFYLDMTLARCNKEDNKIILYIFRTVPGSTTNFTGDVLLWL